MGISQKILKTNKHNSEFQKGYQNKNEEQKVNSQILKSYDRCLSNKPINMLRDTCENTLDQFYDTSNSNISLNDSSDSSDSS